MWIKSFSKEYRNVKKEMIWRAWIDVNNWPKWDTELKYCDLKDEFSEGSQFILKPKRGPKVRLWLSEVVPNVKFTDYCKFFGAMMYDEHVLEETPEGVKITNTITVKGPFTFLWTKLVAKDVAKAIPNQTDNLVKYVRSKA